MSPNAVRVSCALLVALASGSLTAGASTSRVKDVLLVHGAWSDASVWSSVIGILQDHKYTVHASQLYLKSFEEDVAVVQKAIANIGRPVVVAGHSLGGFINSVATTGLPNVTALVYIAAFAPDEGESITSLTTQTPPTIALAPYLIYDKEYLTVVDAEGWGKTIYSGVQPATARIKQVVQKPTFAGLFVVNATTPAWRSIPSYHQISKNDQTISATLQLFMAKRAQAVEILTLDAPHMSLITHPKEVSGLIMRATKGVKPVKTV